MFLKHICGSPAPSVALSLLTVPVRPKAYASPPKQLRGHRLINRQVCIACLSIDGSLVRSTSSHAWAAWTLTTNRPKGWPHKWLLVLELDRVSCAAQRSCSTFVSATCFTYERAKLIIYANVNLLKISTPDLARLIRIPVSVMQKSDNG